MSETCSSSSGAQTEVFYVTCPLTSTFSQRCWGLKQEHCACQLGALPLSSIALPQVGHSGKRNSLPSYLLERNWWRKYSNALRENQLSQFQFSICKMGAAVAQNRWEIKPGKPCKLKRDLSRVGAKWLVFQNRGKSIMAFAMHSGHEGCISELKIL